MTPDQFFEHFDTNYKQKLQPEPFIKNRYHGFKRMFQHLLAKKDSDFTIVETGSLRWEDNWLEGQSSLIFGEFLNVFGGRLITIDLDPESSQACKQILEKRFGGGLRFGLQTVTGNAVTELEKLDLPVDLVYLDAMDIDFDDPTPSMAHHIKELASLAKVIVKSPGLLVAVDDNMDVKTGKGRFVIEWAKATQKEFLYEGWQVVFRM